MMRKIKFWGFDYPQAVVKGAAHLHVSELELFEIAYRGWHKQDTDPAEILHLHQDFQTRGTLPHWVKHYVRQLDARTHFMAEQSDQKRLIFWSWLTRLVVLTLLPGSYGIIKQLLIGQKFSLYC